MLKGKDLLDYTISQIGGDKLQALKLLHEDIYGGGKTFREIMELVNPIVLYKYLEDTILSDDGDVYLINYLEEHSYPLPRIFGWRHTRIESDGNKKELDKIEWYEDKHKCFCDMYKSAMTTIDNAVCGISGETIKITPIGMESITIEAYGSKDVFEVYEMD